MTAAPPPWEMETQPETLFPGGHSCVPSYGMDGHPQTSLEAEDPSEDDGKEELLSLTLFTTGKEEPVPPHEISLARLDSIVATTSGPEPWEAFEPEAREGLEFTRVEARNNRRGSIIDNLLAPWFFVSDSDGSMLRISFAQESALNIRLSQLYEQSLPFEISHLELQIPSGLRCVPLHRQLSFRLSDLLVCGESIWGHCLDYTMLPDTLSALLHETTGATLKRCKESIEYLIQCYEPAKYKIGIAGNVFQRWEDGYQGTSAGLQCDFERFVILHSSFERGAIEMLEAALIDIFHPPLNSRSGGDGSMPGWGPYFCYLVIDTAGSPLVRDRRHQLYHGRR